MLFVQEIPDALGRAFESSMRQWTWLGSRRAGAVTVFSRIFGYPNVAPTMRNCVLPALLPCKFAHYICNVTSALYTRCYIATVAYLSWLTSTVHLLVQYCMHFTTLKCSICTRKLIWYEVTTFSVAFSLWIFRLLELIFRERAFFRLHAHGQSVEKIQYKTVQFFQSTLLSCPVLSSLAWSYWTSDLCL